MKRALCVVLAIITLVALISCDAANIDTSSDTKTASHEIRTEPTDTESTPDNTQTELVDTEPIATAPVPPPSTLSLCGVDISQYVIVYPSSNKRGEKELAELLASYIFSVFSVDISVVSDENETGDHEILLGFVNNVHLTTSMRSKAEAFEKYRVDTYHSTIITVDSHLLILGANENTLKAGVDKLISEISPVEQGSKLNVDFSDNSSIINASIFSGDAITVMSYNIYTNNPNRYRGLQLIGNINSFDPDVLGVQELNSIWIKLFQKYTNLFDLYDMVGKPRLNEKDTSNGNEYSAIFYKKDKFNLIESNTYWLSDTPDQISKFDNTEYYRIMTYAVLERKSDNKVFIHVNTHLATEKGPRQQQIAVLLELADGLLEKYGNDIPMYFTGDFNMTSSDQGYATMLAWGNKDARVLSGNINQEFTCGNSIIDYCFIANDTFQVTDFDVGYGLEGSDHYPVYTELYIK